MARINQPQQHLAVIGTSWNSRNLQARSINDTASSREANCEQRLRTESSVNLVRPPPENRTPRNKTKLVVLF
jgi:hypothetical protein